MMNDGIRRTAGLAVMTGLMVSCACAATAGSAIRLGPPFFNGKVMPTPQQVQYLDTFLTIYDEAAGDISTCILTDASGVRNPAVADLTARIESLGGRIAVVSAESDALRYKNVICVGNNTLSARWLKKDRIRIPAEREGYAIYPVRDKTRHIVICVGRDPLGLTWSMESLIQLFTRDGGQVLLKEARIYDYPYVRWRGGFVCSPAYKHNLVLGGWDAHPGDWRKEYRNPDYLGKIRAGIKEAGRLGVYPLVAFSPVHEKNPALLPSISDPRDLAILLDFVEEIVKAGGIPNPMWDDTGHGLTPSDRAKFGDLGQAHHYMLTKMLERAKAVNPASAIIFCPPVYFGSSLMFYPGVDGSEYVKAMRGLPPDILIEWTGGDVTGRYVSEDLARRWAGQWNRKALFFENDWPWREFDAKDFPGLYPNLYRYIEGFLLTGKGDIGMAALGDYLWNPQAYEPAASLRNAVEHVAGLEIYPVFKRWKELLDRVEELRHLPDPGPVLKDYETEMQQLAAEIADSCANRDFVDLVTGHTKWLSVILAQKRDNPSPSRSEMVWLENDLFRLEIIPSQGGRVNRWIDKETGRNLLFTQNGNPQAVFGDADRAYTEFLVDSSGANIFMKNVLCSVTVDGNRRLAVLSGEAKNDEHSFAVIRTITLEDKTVRFATEIRNEGGERDSVRLRIHPEFALPRMHTLGRYFLFVGRSGKAWEKFLIDPPPGSLNFVGDDLPSGLWGIGDVKENWGIFDSFEPSNIVSCFFFADWDPRLRSLEMMSRFRALGPGETWTISHAYTITNNLSDFLK